MRNFHTLSPTRVPFPGTLTWEGPLWARRAQAQQPPRQAGGAIRTKAFSQRNARAVSKVWHAIRYREVSRAVHPLALDRRRCVGHRAPQDVASGSRLRGPRHLGKSVTQPKQLIPFHHTASTLIRELLLRRLLLGLEIDFTAATHVISCLRAEG